MNDSSGLADHYRHPRNLGELDEPHAVAIVHNPVCGDMLRLAVRVADGRIEAVRFKAYGCAAAIAAGSAATELLKGTSLAEAASIGDEEILELIGPLPPMKVHAVVLAREGIRKALEQLADARGG